MLHTEGVHSEVEGCAPIEVRVDHDREHVGVGVLITTRELPDDLLALTKLDKLS